MTDGRDNCTEAILAYAHDVFARVANGSIAVHEVADEKWQRGSDGVARRQLLAQRFLGLPAEGDPSPLYEKACEAVRADPDFGRVIGGMIGSPMGTVRIDEFMLVNSAAHAPVTVGQSVEMDEEAVRTKVSQLRDYVKAKERLSKVVIPLQGVQSSLFPVEVEQGLEIDVLRDDEIHACATTGVLQPLFPSMGMLMSEDCVGMRISVSQRPLWPPLQELTLILSLAGALPWRSIASVTDHLGT